MSKEDGLCDVCGKSGGDCSNIEALTLFVVCEKCEAHKFSRDIATSLAGRALRKLASAHTMLRGYDEFKMCGAVPISRSALTIGLIEARASIDAALDAIKENPPWSQEQERRARAREKSVNERNESKARWPT